MNDLYQDIYRDIVTRYPSRTVWRREDIAAFERIAVDEASRKYKPGRAGIDTATYARLKAAHALHRMDDYRKRLIRANA
jgi:hypothetical protein